MADRSSKPYSEADASLEDAQRLLSTLTDLTGFLGQIYAELSGHAAASQRVVADLQAGLAFLHSRHSAESSVPEPWLLSARRPSPVQHKSHQQQAAQQQVPEANAGLVTPPPQLKVGLATTPSSGKAAPPAPHSQGPAVRSASVGRARPPLSGQPTVRGGHAGTPAGARSASTARRLQPDTAGQRTLQHNSSLGVLASGGSTGAVARAAASGRGGALTRTNSTPGSINRGKAVTVAATPAPPPVPGNSSPAVVQPPATPSSTDPLRPMHLPAAVGLASSPSNLQGAGSPLVTPQPQAPPPPPQLPHSFRKALHDYRETVQQGEQWVASQLQGQGQQGMATATDPDRPGLLSGALQACVSQAATRFCSDLERHCQAHHHHSTGLLPDPGPNATASELQHAAQVGYAALVAGQTWLVQAFKEISARGQTSSGVSIDSVLGLMEEVKQLRSEYNALQARAMEAAAGVRPLSGATHSSSTSGIGNSKAGSSTAPGAGVSGADEDAAEAEAEAVRWRNRFLRALLAEDQRQQGSQGHHGQQGNQVLGAGRQGLPRPGSAGQGQGLHRGASHMQIPSTSQAVQQVSIAAEGTGGGKLVMPRPLGLWLPDECWVPLLGQAVAAGGAAGADAAAAQPEAVLQQAPWLLSLPTQALRQVASQLSRGAWHTGARSSVPLFFPSTQDMVSHARAQQQLQLYLMQLHLEARIGPGLLPSPHTTKAGLQALHASLQQQHQQGSHATSRQGSERRGAAGNSGIGVNSGADVQAGERLLAQLRLAHAFLFKNAWTRGCIVVEQASEQQAEVPEKGL